MDSWDRDHRPCKAYSIYSLALYRRNLLALDLVSAWYTVDAHLTFRWEKGLVLRVPGGAQETLVRLCII